MSKYKIIIKDNSIPNYMKRYLKEAKKELKSNHGTDKQIEKLLENTEGDDFSLGFDYGYMRGVEVALAILQANEHKTK